MNKAIVFLAETRTPAALYIIIHLNEKEEEEKKRKKKKKRNLFRALGDWRRKGWWCNFRAAMVED